MAAAFCNLSQGCGVKTLLHCHCAKQSCKTRSSGAELYSSGASRRASLYCGRQNLFQCTHGRRFPNLESKRHLEQVFSVNRTDYHGDVNEGEHEEDVGRMTLIWRAIKLPIYSVALVPLTVGCSAAYLYTGVFSAKRYFVLLASSVLNITWLNLSNDAYDFDTGADKNKKESVVNLLGSRTGTIIAAYLCLALGFTGLAWTSIGTGNIRAILLLTCSTLCGYIYQCPPFRLSYQGLGEPLCFSAFGPFTTTAFYMILGSARDTSNPPLTGGVLSASVLVGFTTTLILFCSHFHQVEEDRAVGKISPLVRIGTEGGSRVVKVAVMALYACVVAFGLSKTLPFTCTVLCALTFPMGRLVMDFVEENHKNKGRIFMAKYYCVRLHVLFGAALAVGLAMARVLK